MTFYDILFSALNGWSSKLTHYGNLFADFMGGLSKLLAKILKIKGNTIVWNQLIQNGNFASADGWGSNDGLTFSASNNILTATVTGTVGGSTQIRRLDAPLKKGHTYFVSVDANPSKAVSFRFCYPAIADPATVKQMPQGTWTNYSIVSKMTDNSAINYLYVNVTGSLASNDTIQLKNYIMVDLTQMFGSGNEPSTVEEFTSLFPLPYYSYDSVSLLSFNGTGIKSVGFNQWDEEWENGTFNTTTGANVDYTTTQIRSKNPIPVIPNKQYYVKASPYLWAMFLDNNLQPVDPPTITSGYPKSGKSIGIGESGTVQFTVPYNASYMKFYGQVGYGATYNHDICINISSSENGTYKPYKSNTLSLPISTYFPTGMKDVGTGQNKVYDELDLVNQKAITRVGEVDLGSMDWNYTAGGQGRFYSSSIADVVKIPSTDTGGNCKCAKYTSGRASDVYQGFAGICIQNGTGQIWVYDPSYNGDANAFKTAMSGVYLGYELADYVETTIDPPLDLYYPIEWGGTEQLLPENTSTPTTSPILADIQYPDGERDDQYFIYREITKTNVLLGKSLNTIMGREVEFNREALDILMKGE